MIGGVRPKRVQTMLRFGGTAGGERGVEVGYFMNISRVNRE
jgi:hypothetical protein